MKNLHTKKTDKNVVFAAGIFASSVALTTIAGLVFNPIIKTHATESKEAEISLTVGSTLGLRLDKNNLNLEANVGDFVSGSINADVTTNSQYGYTLTLEDSDNESSLVHTNSSVEDKLTSLYSGAKTSSTMTDNTWGFSLNETDYYYIPVLGNPVALKRTNGATSGDYETTKVDFGAKVGMTLTAGTYTDVVKFTAYTNGADPDEFLEPGEVPENRTISDITTMQEMNSTICENTALHTVANLKDTRDNNTYSVAKLKDGNCWMTSNLRLIDYTVTSADSDVDSSVSYHVPASDSTQFSNTGPSGDDYFKFSAAYYDETYGGYYNFYTAVAGWRGSETAHFDDLDSPQSICPKNWRLPTGSYGGEYEAIRDQYISWSSAPAYAEYLLSAPVNFTLNGRITQSGSATDQGQTTNLWSSTSYSNYQYAHYMWISQRDLNNPNSNDMTNPTSYTSPSYGYGVRCIAR